MKDEDARHASLNEDRRYFLQGLTAILGSAAVSQLLDGSGLASALAYNKQGGNSESALKLFNEEQLQIVRHIADVILPKTETPSASELGVHRFVDHQLATVYSEAQRENILQLFNKVEFESLQGYGRGFADLNMQQQHGLLERLESAEMPFAEADKQEFKQLKSLVIFGYFTTEFGATQVLAYQAVPGGFNGALPYSEVGKAWGSLAYY